MIVTFIALRLVDRAGRRPLILGGTADCVVALLALGGLYLLPSQDGVVGYLIVVLLMIYIASFAASLGIAIWLLNAEVYPTPIRGKAGSLGTTAHWSLDFVVALTVLSIIGIATETGLFWLYAAFGIAGFLVPVPQAPRNQGPHPGGDRPLAARALSSYPRGAARWRRPGTDKPGRWIRRPPDPTPHRHHRRRPLVGDAAETQIWLRAQIHGRRSRSLMGSDAH
jgi:MFS family permease